MSGVPFFKLICAQTYVEVPTRFRSPLEDQLFSGSVTMSDADYVPTIYECLFGALASRRRTIEYAANFCSTNRLMSLTSLWIPTRPHSLPALDIQVVLQCILLA